MKTGTSINHSLDALRKTNGIMNMVDPTQVGTNTSMETGGTSNTIKIFHPVDLEISSGLFE